MHGLLASQSCYHSVLPLVCVHCGPVVDFFITKQTSVMTRGTTSRAVDSVRFDQRNRKNHMHNILAYVMS